MKIILTLLLFAISAYGQDITVDYDKFRNETSITLAEQVATGEGTATLTYTAKVKGKNPRGIPFATAVMFGMRSEEWQFKTANTLRVLLNAQERLEVGSMQRMTAKVDGDGVIEVLLLEVPLATIQKIADARNVEMQIRIVEFALTPAQIRRLRNFVGYFAGTIPKTRPRKIPKS